MNREEVFAWAGKTFGSKPEYLWKKSPDAAVLRHKDNRKWYGIVMKVRRDRLGLAGDDAVDILDVKTDPVLAASLQQKDGILPGYHMNKTNWITILLDGTVPEEQIISLLDMSFALTAPKKRK